jgi:hypothetical protein
MLETKTKTDCLLNFLVKLLGFLLKSVNILTTLISKFIVELEKISDYLISLNVKL